MVFSNSTLLWLKDAFQPVIYAVILAYLLDSAVSFFVRKLKVRRSQGILLACLILLILAGFLLYMLVPQILDNINNIIDLMEGNVDIVQILNGIKEKINNQYVQSAADYILHASESVRNTLDNALKVMSGILVQFISSMGSSAFTIVTSFIINIYMLIEKEDILARGKRFIYAFFDDKSSGKIFHIFTLANKIFKSFINGKLLDSFIVGVISIIVFFIFKVPYSPLMGTIVGAFNLIPYFGPIIGSIPVVLVSFFANPPKALTALIIIIVVQQVDSNLLDPRIVGVNVGVSPFWIIVSVTVGGKLFGIWGMIVSVPIIVLIKTIAEESVSIRLIEKGIGDIEKDKLRVTEKRK